MVENTLHQLGLDGYLPESCKHARSVENLLYMLEAVLVKRVTPVNNVVDIAPDDLVNLRRYLVERLSNYIEHATIVRAHCIVGIQSNYRLSYVSQTDAGS